LLRPTIIYCSQPIAWLFKTVIQPDWAGATVQLFDGQISLMVKIECRRHGFSEAFIETIQVGQ
jgi:hypothetical protein